MRVLALDYGSARCGVAISDPTGTIVTPLAAVPRPLTRRGMAALKALVAEREVERVVVGLPLSLRGDDTQQTRETREFVRRLARELNDPAGRLEGGRPGGGGERAGGGGERAGTGSIPVEMHDERFTTRMAQRMGGASAEEDSRAAAHLLESWLVVRDRQRPPASSS